MTKEKTLSDKRILDKEIPRVYYLGEDVKQALQEFANILKNNQNPEFAEYNEMLLNDLKEIFGEELLK